MQVPKPVVQTVIETRVIEPQKVQPSLPATSNPLPEAKPPDPPKTKAIEYSTFVEKFLEEYRPRLSAFLLSADGKKMLAKIDFYEGDRVYQTFSIQEIIDFGYIVERKSYGVLISKNGKQYPVTPWPLDIQNNVPDRAKPGLGHPL